MKNHIAKINQKVVMNWIFTSLILSIFLTSCLPLKQTYGEWEDQGVLVIGESNYVRIYIDSKNYPSKPEILSEISYARHYSGKQYPIIANPTELLDPRNTQDNGDYLHLKSSQNSMSKYNSWDDGFWTVYLKLKCGDKIYDKNVSFELDTFYYNPIIHGAPN